MNEIAEVLLENLSSATVRGDEIRALCPFHSDTTPSFFVNIRKGVYHCFGCGAAGSINKLARYIPELRPLVEDLKITPSIQHKGDPFRAPFILDEADKAAYLSAYPVELEHYGKDLLREHEVGFDRRMLCAVWTIRDFYGNLAGFVRRLGRPGVKYAPIIKDLKDKYGNYKFEKGKFLWNIHRVKSNAGPIIVAEGFKAALWIIKAGFDAVALMGTALTHTQLEMLTLLGRPVFLFLDNDISGLTAIERIGRKLYKRVNVYVCEYPTRYKQPDEMSLDQVRMVVVNAKPFALRRRLQWDSEI